MHVTKIMEISDYLDLLAKSKGFKTDTQVGDFLGKAQSTISQWRTGIRLMDEETALTIARELGMEDERPVLAARKIAYAEKHGQETLWTGFMQRAAKAAGTVALSCILPLNVNNFLTPQDLTIDKTTTYEQVINNNINYANYA